MAKIFAIAVCLIVCAAPASAQAMDSVLVEEYAVGSFQRATRIVAGTQGKLFIIDEDENKIFLFSGMQEPPKTLGGFGWSSYSFDRPTGVATDGVNIYVSDYGNHRIQRFDRNLNYISSLSTRDTSDALSRFGYPRDVALSGQGDLFILDGENIRVVMFNAQNYFERVFGDINAGMGKLRNPERLAATNSRVFVGDQDVIREYDYFGNYLGRIGDGVIHNLSGFTVFSDEILAASPDSLWWFTRDGALVKVSSLDKIISGERIDRIQDIACNGKQLFILSPHQIHVFPMSH